MRLYFLRNILFCIAVLSATNALGIEIASDEVAIDTEASTYELIGKAKVKHMHNKKKNIFKSDKITVYCKNNSINDPKKIVANGRISFTNDEFTVVSNTCEFDMNVVSFDGNVTVNSKELGSIKADSAKYNVKTKKIDIQSKKNVELRISDSKSKQIQKKMKK